MFRRTVPWLDVLGRRRLNRISGFSNFLSDYSKDGISAKNAIEQLNLNDLEFLKWKALMRTAYQSDIDKEGFKKFMNFYFLSELFYYLSFIFQFFKFFFELFPLFFF